MHFARDYRARIKQIVVQNNKAEYNEMLVKNHHKMIYNTRLGNAVSVGTVVGAATFTMYQHQAMLQDK